MRYGWLGQLDKTAENLTASLQQRDAQSARVGLACTQLYLGHRAAFAAARSRLLTEALGPDVDRETFVILALLAPAGPQELSAAKRLLGHDAAAGVQNPAAAERSHDTYVRLLAEGMYQYRSGDYASAARSLARCRDVILEAHSTAADRLASHLSGRLPMVSAYLSMNEERLGHHDAAVAALAAAREQLRTELPSIRSGSMEVGATHWLAAHIALREAAMVVNGSPANMPTRPSAPPP